MRRQRFRRQALALASAFALALSFGPSADATPEPVVWSLVAAGHDNNLALKSDGTLWAWGWNYYGQLGTGDTTDRIIPTKIGADTDWQTVAAGYFHTLALKSDGSLWAWGYNGDGRLGTGDTDDRLAPTRIGTDTDWLAVAAGHAQSLALKSDGTLWAWGGNDYGQLGTGDTTQRTAPTKIGADTDWLAVAAGGFHSLALKSDDTLWAWGWNNNGQLGTGDTTDRIIPTKIGADTDWLALSAAYYHSLALKSDDTLWAWGRNDFGALGTGDTTQRTAPTKIGSDTDWQASAAGKGSHNVALKSDGTLWAWGLNNYGQLGIPWNHDTPTKVGSDTDWQAIAAGGYYTLGLKSDGTLWAWGANNYGQLATGDTVDRSTPTLFDQIPPDIAISGVTDGAFYKTTVSPTFSATDPNLDSVSATLDGAAFASGTEVSDDGTHILVVEASDKIGNRAEETVSFTIDQTAPDVTIGGVTDGSFYAIPVAPTFSATDTNLDTVSATRNGVPFVSGTTISADGAYTVVVNARDKAGNESTKTVSFTVDGTGPVISVGGVTEGSFYTTPVTPTFSATDANLDTVSATKNGVSFISGTTISTNGSYTLVVTARDKAGNQSTMTVSFVAAVTAVYQDFTGTDRYQTAIMVTKEAYPGGAPAVFLVKGDNFPDALSAAPLAAAYGGPVVITPSTGLTSAIVAELKRLDPSEVFFIGLPDSVKPALEAALPAARIITIRGMDRYHTAVLIGEELKRKLATQGKTIERVVLASGDKFPDALSVAPLAAQQGWAILLTPQAGPLPKVTADEVAALGVTKGVVVGTRVALPSQVTQVTRLVGTDRYDTSAQVAAYAKSMGLSFRHVALTKGDNYPDALVVTPYLVGDRGILLLTTLTTLPKAIRDTLIANAADIRTVDFVGLGPTIQPEVKGLLP